MHQHQDISAQQHHHRRHDHRENSGQPHAVRNELPHTGVILRPEFMGHRDRKTIADAHTETYDHKVDGTRGTHPGERFHAQKLPHDDRIHHTVELLK